MFPQSHVHTTFYLFTQQSVNNWAVFWLLSVMLLWVWVFNCLCQTLLGILWDTYPEVESNILGDSVFGFWGTSILFLTSGFTIFHICTQCKRFPSHSHPHLLAAHLKRVWKCVKRKIKPPEICLWRIIPNVACNVFKCSKNKHNQYLMLMEPHRETFPS